MGLTISLILSGSRNRRRIHHSFRIICCRGKHHLPLLREKTMAINLLDQYEQYELEEDDPLGCCKGIMVAAGIELAGVAVVLLLYHLFF